MGVGKECRKKILNFLVSEFRNLRVKAYPSSLTIGSLLISRGIRARWDVCGPRESRQEPSGGQADEHRAYHR